MTSFLTVEDINTAIFSNQQFYWYEIDTSKISEETNYSDVEYDFCKITKEPVASGMFAYKYTLKIYLDNWTKLMYLLDQSDEFLRHNGRVVTDGVEIRTDEKSFKCYLLLGNIDLSETPVDTKYLVLKEQFDLNLKQLNTPQSIPIYNMSQKRQETLSKQLDKGYNIITKEIGGHIITMGCVLVNLIKTDLQFSCNQSVIIGKVNTVAIGTDSEYKPNGDMIGTNTPNITVEYNGKTLPVTWNTTLNDYCFDLDLTDKTNIGNIRFKVLIDSNEVINASETTVILQSQYQSVSSFSDLKSACATGGIDIVQVGGNITFTESIPVKHSIKIIGNSKSFDLNEHSIILDEGIQFNAEKVSFSNGDTAIIQGNNSKVDLTDCSFTNCTSSNFNGLGSCIFCDTDITNLDNPTDFETNLNNCTFTDNQSCIFHSGQLTVNNCKLHNTDTDYVNTNNVAFVYQTDGYATIKNSVFDIDYNTNDFCTGEVNLGFAQSILMCGETANINGATYLDLGDDNTLPFFSQTIDNQSHLFAKYYYPKAETCVYASPVSNYENKSCCHAVSGVDWIFKNNIQITRVSWNTQNERRTITWED